jgi:hypothetical protein
MRFALASILVVLLAGVSMAQDCTGGLAYSGGYSYGGGYSFPIIQQSWSPPIIIQQQAPPIILQSYSLPSFPTTYGAGCYGGLGYGGLGLSGGLGYGGLSGGYGLSPYGYRRPGILQFKARGFRYF